VVPKSKTNSSSLATFNVWKAYSIALAKILELTTSEFQAALDF